MKIYTGPRGSGKTAHSVNDAMDKLSYKRHNNVVANFGLKFSKRQINKKKYNEKFHFVPNDELTPKKLMELSARNGWYKEEGCTLLIIDEAGLFFNARDWQVKGKERMEWIDFFVNSRKLGFDPVLIAQNIKMVDRQIRDIIEHNVKHAKLNNLHWFKWLPIPMFVTITKWLIGDFKPQIKFHFLNPLNAKRYDTMKLFNKDILKLIEELSQGEQSEGEGVRGPTPLTGTPDMTIAEESKKNSKWRARKKDVKQIEA